MFTMSNTQGTQALDFDSDFELCMPQLCKADAVRVMSPAYGSVAEYMACKALSDIVQRVPHYHNAEMLHAAHVEVCSGEAKHYVLVFSVLTEDGMFVTFQVIEV
jgi:hypothetical protein